MISIDGNTTVLIITGLAVIFAYLKEKISLSAVVSTAVIGFIVVAFGGVQWVAPLTTFFVIGVLVTEYKKGVKKKHKCDQIQRTYKNVVGNGAYAAVCACGNAILPNPLWYTMMVTGMASATADSVATEIGQVYGKNPFNPITFRPAQIGETGAVSVQGLMAGVAGASVVSLYAYQDYGRVIFFAMYGCVLDSITGITLEEEFKVIDTHQNNLLATTVAGTLYGVSYLTHAM
jgi:uncharacterized protein (TIGR00297 family)